MKIRRLDADKVEAVKLSVFLRDTFGAEFHFGSRTFPEFSEGRSWAYIWPHFTHGAVWAVEDDEGYAGTISLSKKCHWWSDKEYLADGWFYVRPEKRNSRAAIMLMNAASEFAKEQGLPVSITLSLADDLDRKDAFLRRFGFERLGATYLKEN